MFRRITKSVLAVLATLALGAWSCQVPNQPNQSSPEPSATARPTAYPHQPIGQLVTPPPNAPAEYQGKGFYWVRTMIRVYDEHGVEAIGFDSPKVHFHLDVATFSGNKATIWDSYALKPSVAPVDFDHEAPIKDEQHFETLTTRDDGTLEGILDAIWVLTVTLNPGWKIECTVTDVASQETVSHRWFKNTSPTTVRGETSCFWPFDPQV